MEVKLDLDNNKFSEQNAFFLAKMAKIAYDTPEEVKAFLESIAFWGTGVPANQMFEWFEVRRGIGDYGLHKAVPAIEPCYDRDCT